MNPLQQRQQQRQQQQLYQQKFETEVAKITLSWNNTLKEWHPIALKALDFTSCLKVNMHPLKYMELFESDVHGINMNIVVRLANNLEERTPREMECTPQRWAEILALNEEVGRQWNALAEPVKQKLNREFEIMNGKEAGLKLVKAEA